MRWGTLNWDYPFFCHAERVRADFCPHESKHPYLRHLSDRGPSTRAPKFAGTEDKALGALAQDDSVGKVS
jgi:hypothetical protein